jgi:hypothetical protein
LVHADVEIDVLICGRSCLVVGDNCLIIVDLIGCFVNYFASVLFGEDVIFIQVCFFF